MKKIGKTISDVLKDLRNARLCLPEFQRDFIWKPKQVADLMMSILRGYPIGWLLFLSYRKNRRIEPRPISDTQPSDYKDCKYLVLDGQQRLTSIHKVFDVAKKGIFEYRDRYYFLYMDVDKIDRKSFHDLGNQFVLPAIWGSKEKCYQYLDDIDLQVKYKEVALNVFLNDDEWRCWLRKAKNIIKKTQINELKSIKHNLKKYDISFDVIHDEIENVTLCNIFEKINSTGTRLNIFDLKVADFEKDGIALRKLWKDAKEEYPDLRVFDIDPIYILKIIALTRKVLNQQGDIRKVSCAERDVNNLRNLYARNFKAVFEADWKKAIKFLRETLNYYESNYGVDHVAKNPYVPMLIVYTSILWWADESGGFKFHELVEKLSLWYWRSIFLKRYEKSTNTVISDDFFLLQKWISGRIKNIPFPKYRPVRLKQISSNRDAIYRGVLCLPMSNNAQDLMKPTNLLNSYVEDHHIFPKKWLERKGFDIKSELVNCVLNRTYILAETNVAISDKPPSEYFYELSEDIYNGKIGRTLKEKLSKHFIDESALRYIQKNKFKKFIKEREELIQKEIKRKTRS